MKALTIPLKSAYLELEERAGQLGSPKGAKAEMVLGAIRAQLGSFGWRISNVPWCWPGMATEIAG
jgi:hypothetical protein